MYLFIYALIYLCACIYVCTCACACTRPRLRPRPRAYLRHKNDVSENDMKANEFGTTKQSPPGTKPTSAGASGLDVLGAQLADMSARGLLAPERACMRFAIPELHLSDFHLFFKQVIFR